MLYEKGFINEFFYYINSNTNKKIFKKMVDFYFFGVSHFKCGKLLAKAYVDLLH